MKWTKENRALLYTALTNQYGPYDMWDNKTITNNPVIEGFAKMMDTTPMAVIIQINYAVANKMPSAAQLDHGAAVQTILGKAAAYEAGFISTAYTDYIFG